MKRTKLMLGDNIEALRKLPDNSIDSVVTDPPYGLSFMNKKWDYDVPSVEFWKEVYRVLKPGGHILSFGGTRTYHRMVVNIEDAGFEIRDQIMWLYGSGFPKSCNISKQIDKKYGRLGYDLTDIKNKLKDLYKASGKTMKKIDEQCGFKATGYLRIEHRDDDGWGEALPTLERWEKISEVIGCSVDVFNEYKSYFEEAEREITGKGKAGFLEKNNVFEMNNEGYGDFNLTKSKTKEGQEWEGWGTALKPANEPICVARKPLSEKSVAENVLKWKTGGINIDGCRVGTELISHGTSKMDIRGKLGDFHTKPRIEVEEHITEGRFPANIILECCCDEVIKGEKGEVKTTNRIRKMEAGGGLEINKDKSVEGIDNYGDKGDIHTNPECPCYQLDSQSKSSRFFYQAKVSKKERNMGLDGFEEKKKEFETTTRTNKETADKFGCERKGTAKNNHPTIKPINLMTYLCRLVTPEGGIVLDPFMGSGSTGVAALLEGFRFCGMEMDKDYFKIAEARIENYEQYREFLKK